MFSVEYTIIAYVKNVEAADMAQAQISVLLAEDEEILQEMLAEVLVDENYKVDAAGNGEEALALLNTNRYDILISDLFMPEMNGVDLISRCQKLYPVMKTILLCGGGHDVQAEHGKQDVKYLEQEISVDMFLKKPCDLDELLSTVEKLLA